MPLSKNDLWIKTFGNLYKKLAFTTGEILIGLLRTIKDNDNESVVKFSLILLLLRTVTFIL